MPSLLQAYSDRNKTLGDNSYDIPQAVPAAQTTTEPVQEETKEAPKTGEHLNTMPGFSPKPLRGAVVRGDDEKGFTRWDAVNQTWAPVKTFKYKDSRYWWDDSTERFYPF